jgi:membrane protease YdiL (CAAX protease family)
MNATLKEILVYTGITLGLTFCLAAIAYAAGGLKSFSVVTISMYIPALVALCLHKFWLKKPLFKGNDLGLNFKGIKYWPLAILVVFAIEAAGFLLSAGIKPGFFQSTQHILADTEESGLGVGVWQLNLIIIFGVNLFIAPVLNILIFLGEEIGWRAYLFPRLLKVTSPKMSFLLSGIIWGSWHAGGILLGYNYPNYSVAGLFMMMFMCIPVGLVIQYFYFKSGSIFAAALAHGSLNWTAANFLMFVVENPNYNRFIYGPTGIIGIALFWLAAIYFYRKIDWKKVNPLKDSPNVPKESKSYKMANA